MSKENTNPFGEGFQESATGKFVDWGGTDRTGARKSDAELAKVYVVEEGDVLKGTFTGETFTTPNYNNDGEQTNYNIELESGDVVVVGSRGKIMDQTLKKLVEGQRVAFLYEGLKKSKSDSKKEYKSIRIALGQIDTDWLDRNNKLPEENVDDIEM